MTRHRSLAERLLAGGTWALAGRLVSAIGTFVISVLVARILSPESVGVYFLAFSLATALAIVARGGLDKTTLRLVAESLSHGDEGRARKAVIHSFAIAACLVAIVAAVIVLAAPIAGRVFDSAELASLSGLLAWWVAYLAFELLVAETFRGFDRISLASLFSGALSRVFVVGALGLLYASGRAELRTVVTATVVAGTLSLLPAVSPLLRSTRRLAKTVSSDLPVRVVLQVARPLLVTNMAFFVSRHADLWILAAFRPENEVALYGVALRLVLLIGMSLSIVDAVIPPLIAQFAAANDPQRLETLTRATATVAALPAALALGALIVFGGPILEIGFGSFYRDAHILLVILSAGQSANIFAGSCGYVLIMTGHQTDLMRAALAGGAVTILGSLALVTFLGPVGVATAAALGMVTHNLLTLLLVRQRCGVWTSFSIRHLRLAATRLHSMIRSRAAQGSR